MRWKVRLFISYNTLLRGVALLIFLFWPFFRIAVFLFPARNLFLLIVASLLFTLAWSGLSAVRLKLRILKEMGDPGRNLDIRKIYKSASRVNYIGYAIFFPLLSS